MTDPVDPLTFLEEERMRPTGSRLEFQRQLAACDHALVAVAELVGNRVVPVTTAFLQADAHAALAEIAADAEVDRRCAELEDICFALLARQSPVAGDLRRIVAVLRSVQDVQRSGDLLRHVAESLTWVHPPSLPAELRDTVEKMGAAAGAILLSGAQAWRTHDALAANELTARDDHVDLLHKVLLTDLYTGRHAVEEAVSLALIARYYERIADHGVEIARQVVYFLTGDRLSDPE